LGAECIAIFESARAPAGWVETRAKIAPAAVDEGKGASDDSK